MMKFKLFLLIAFFCCRIHSIGAQQPAHFILGENEFKGVRIFDMIQDNQDNYYFATNEGIMVYDFIQYKKLETKEARSESFFNLVKDKKGVIYFHNLNNQIFKITGNQCKLVYTLPERFSTNIINLACNESDELIITCKGIIILSETGKIVAIKESSLVYNTYFKLKNGQWAFPASGANEVILYNNQVFQERKLTFKGKNSDTQIGVLYFFEFLGKPYVIDVSLHKFYRFDESQFALEEIESGNFLNSTTNARIHITKNQLWSPSSISGINCINNDNFQNFSVFFKDYFISNILQDKEGNILLSTFDKGVIVIPNMEIKDVIDPFQQDPIISIFAASKNEVYMGSHRGLLKSYLNNTIHTISSVNKKPIEGIYGDHSGDFIIYDDEEIKCYNRKTKEIYSFSNASLKDVCFVEPNRIFIGTNVGVYEVLLGSKGKFEIQFLKDLRTRIYSLAYDKLNDILYVSSANGLLKLHNNRVEKIQYNQQDIFSEKIWAYGDKIFILSRQFGTLEVNSRKQFSRIDFKLPYPKEQIKNIHFYKNTIIASSRDGLYQFDFKGNILQQFHTVYGFSGKKIYQYSIAENTLWISHSGGVQEIALDQHHGKLNPVSLLLRQVLVNDAEAALAGKHVFNATQRKFTFVVVSPSLNTMNSVKYHYQLQGYDNQWNEQTSPYIQFNALSPGNYTLRVKASYTGKFSEEVQYKFQIQKPFYLQIWFILFSLILFLGIVSLVYMRQVEKQKNKLRLINELNMSKLTAIQSQMNPHFIFNSLNSIQDLILQQDSVKAYEAIGKFATLIRKIMMHSEKEFIDIEEELSMLQVYLELEMMRFKKDFSYTINSHDLHDIEIPPMLIQPYIENSIKHGLMHKKGEKLLLIDMYIKEDVFYCVIEDNGIGRQASGLIRARQNNAHTSFSGSALEKRMDILKKLFGGDFSTDTVDLYDENGNACGTKVILKAPYKQMF